MLLTIDVGNTQTVLGCFEGERLVQHWRIFTDSRKTADEHEFQLGQLLDSRGFSMAELDGLAVSSVVPVITNAYRMISTSNSYLRFLIVEPGIKTSLPVQVDNPREVGADRIVNSVAAKALYSCPAVVVDMGTATTFDVVSKKGEYIGGVILPGVEIALDALVNRTAALRRVELIEPRSVVGKSTVEAIQSGVLYGAVATIDGICQRIRNELAEDLVVVATGGLAQVVAPMSKEIDHHDPWLTLHGLRLLFEMNLAQ